MSLREVKERSEGLAKMWGSRSYEISSSWRARLERGTHEMTVPKLISLATIYSKPPEELLREYHPESARLACSESVSGPNVTLLVTEGGLTLGLDNFCPTTSRRVRSRKKPCCFPWTTSYHQHPIVERVIGRVDRTLDP